MVCRICYFPNINSVDDALKAPFFKSLPAKYLSIATGLMVLIVPLLPFTPLAVLFGFVRITRSFYGWVLLIVAAYIFSAELAMVL